MDLRKKTIHGLIWSAISQVGQQISQILIAVVLARLLSPDDFGLLGMATVFTGFVAIFGELGISSALIQKQDINDKHLSSAFWLNISTGILLTLIFIMGSSAIAKFYNKPELKPIMVVLSFNFIFVSFAIVQRTILTKDMNFKALAIRDTLAFIISGILGIYLAYNGYGVWSLVYQLFSFTIINSILLWVISKWRPKFIFSISAIKDILSFSLNLTGFNIVNYFARNIDQLLIGKFLGAQALGLYSLAYRIMLYPLQNISIVVSRVMFPAFSKIQLDLENVRNIYLKMVKAISLITFPLMFGLFTIAPELINVILGPKWRAVVILIKIFCVCGMIQSICAISGNIFLSQGRADIPFKVGVIGAIIIFVCIAIGLQWGVLGVVLFYTCEQLLWGLFVMKLTGSLIKVHFINFYIYLKNSIIIGLGVMLFMWVIRSILHFDYPINLMVSIASGIIFYISLLFIFKEIYFKQNKIMASVVIGQSNI